MSAGNFDASASTAGTFKTSGGAHTINGDVTLADSKTLTVGATAGAGGATILHGTLQVGAPGNTKASTFNGGVTVTNGITMSGGDFDASAGAGLFKTTTGAHTLNGDVTVGTASSNVKTLTVTGATTSTGNFVVGSGSAASTSTLWGAVESKVGATVTAGGLTVTAGGITLSAGDFNAGSSTGTFTTSSGANTLSGDTTVTGAKTFTVGTGATSLGGTLAVTGTATLSAATTVSAGGLTVTAGGLTVTAGDFTLTAGAFDASASSGTFKTSTGDHTISGSVTLDGAKNFVHGAAGATGTATFYSTLTVGAPAGNVRATTLYGDLLLKTGDFDASLSSGAFKTTTGTNTMSGNVYVAPTKTLTVGDQGNAGATTLYGAVNIGASGATATTTIYGATTVNEATLTAASGIALTGGNFAGSGAGTFTTPTGDITLNGGVTIADGKTFTVGQAAGSGGTTTLKGNLVVGSTGNYATITLDGKTTVNYGADPALVVANGMSITAGNFDASASSGTFSATTGAATLPGATTVSGASFTVNSGSIANLIGNVNLGQTSASPKSVVCYSNFLLRSDDTGAPTFKLHPSNNALTCSTTGGSTDVCVSR